VKKISTHFDIVIVGAGLVGTSLALLLQKTNLSVAIIEARPFKSHETDQGKALALSYGSYRVFLEMGLWPELDAQATPIQQVHISEKGRFARVKLKAEEAKLPVLGYLVNEPILSGVLQRHLEKAACELFCPAQVTEIHQDDKEATLKLSDGRNITANLVIAVDGQQSTIRRLLNIPVKETDYQQSAIVARVNTSAFHGYTAYERFTDKGTIALMPQPGNQISVIISADNTIIKEWQAYDDAQLLEALQKKCGYRVGRFLSIGKRSCYPLKAVIAEKQIVPPRVILAGNAAHSIHPIAAQGLNLSLYDASMLVDLLKQMRDEKKSFDTIVLLNSYLERVKSYQKQVIGFTKTVVDMFHSKSASKSILRQLGLAGFEYSECLKRGFIQRATGYSARFLRTADENNFETESK